MEVKEIDYAKLNEAVEKFGSLQKANAQLETDKLALEKKNAQFKQENDKLSATRNTLASQVEDISDKVKSYQSQLQSLANQVKVYSYQYELFYGFMAMVTECSSIADSIDTIIASFQKLKEPGWHLPKNADELRSLFVRTVMGDYLKCFHCDACGAKFITNKKPKYKFFGNGYYCPVCHNWYAVKEDDSFLKALVSEKQLEDTLHLEEVLKETEVLGPFKAFFNVPCEICHEPVKEWDDYNVKLAIEGTGYGHTHCWKSELGRLIELRKAVEKVKKDIK
jgi:FtsZ-binding cell division protein ZapB